MRQHLVRGAVLALTLVTTLPAAPALAGNPAFTGHDTIAGNPAFASHDTIAGNRVFADRDAFAGKLVVAGHDAGKAVRVVGLSVNSLDGDQAAVGDPRPTLGWRMMATASQGNPCFDDNAPGRCALDRQTAYEVKAASSPADLAAGYAAYATGAGTFEFGSA